MLTDWLIIRRLAAELDELLGGARVSAAGALPGGRFALRTAAGLVAFDVFGPMPVATIEGEAPLVLQPGFPRAASEALAGLRIDRVAARRGDRLLAFDCSARSRFGVEAGYRLVAELVPRYGNLVLLKGGTVVSSAKSFRAGGATRRTVTAGRAYEPPPLPANGAPRIPRMVAESLALEGPDGGTRVRERADAELSAEQTDLSQPVYVYREGGLLVQLHTVPLLQYSMLQEERATRLLPLLGEALAAEQAGSAQSRFPARRAALGMRIERHAAALAQERAALDAERERIADRDRLRRAGDALYAYGDRVEPGASQFIAPDEPEHLIELDPRLDSKANAASYFKRYKKAAAALAHLERRFERLQAKEGLSDELLWAVAEAEDEATLEELTRDVELALNPRTPKRAAAIPTRRQALEISIAPDAKILVGRSPRINADLTFRIARPEDLWFHARNIPGAHVILRIDGGRKPAPKEIARAAELAAFHSRGKDAGKVAVDYTERKHVRKQRGAAPGLVWYTDAHTVTVAPRDAPAS
jgi:predicted ribosome quality control (RQC) complex YloA/Tae2 family protein